MEKHLLSPVEYAFQQAILRNDIRCAEKIVDLGQLAYHPDIPQDGVTVLHVAAALGFEKCVKKLIELGSIEVNALDGSSWIPLMYAIANRHVNVVKLLLETEKCDLSLKDNYHQTVLHIEAQTSAGECCLAELLLEHGAVIDIEDTEGMTPFLRAVEAQNLETARVLHLSGCSIRKSDHRGRSALHLATIQQFEDMVQWLLRIGCSVNALDNNLQTPLMTCVQQRKSSHTAFCIMKYLLEAGSRVNMQDCRGDTALLLAMSNPSTIKKNHIKLLLVCGADPNIANQDGLTPIWQAVFDGIPYQDRIDIIHVLLHQNCYLDMSCRGRLLFMCGQDSVYCYEKFVTPLEVAMDSGFYEAAKMLIMAGCEKQADLRCNSYTTDPPTELQWLQEVLVTPPSLEHQCRLVVRKLLGRMIESKVKKLPLPPKMRRYILLQDVVDVVTI